jgi:hypothetical protein
LNLGEAQDPIVGMDGFQNAFGTLHEPHGGWIGDSAVARGSLCFFLSIRTVYGSVGRLYTRELDVG